MSGLPTALVRLCFCFLMLLSNGDAFAEEPAPSALEEVVVTSTRLPDKPMEIRTLPAKVTIITADEIARAGAKTVQEAVQQATGIVLYDAVGNAFQQTVDLRGFNGQPVPSTSVFVDGVRLNEPNFNTVNFDLIPVEMVERIEILPGSSAIYGKNALGGVINILTKRGRDKRFAAAETLFGSFHRERYSLNTGGPLGKADYLASFSREIEDGFRDESDARISRFFGKLGYRPAEGTDLTVSYTYVKDRLLQAGSLPLSQAAIDAKRNFTPSNRAFLSRDASADFFDSETNVVTLNGRLTLPLGLSLSLNGFYRRLAQELYTVGQTLTGDNLTETESRGGALQLTHESNPGGLRNVLVMGGEFSRSDFGSKLSAASAFGPFSNLRDSQETVSGLYVQDTLHLTSKLTATTGVRYDQNDVATDFLDSFTPPGSNQKTYTRVTPRAGVTYSILPETSVFASYTQGFRAPTIDELFTAPGLFGTSNPGLKPVSSQNYELGVRTRFRQWGDGTLAFFYTDVRNEILFVCGDPSCAAVAANQNVDKTRRSGIEATLTGRYARLFDGVVNYTFTEATFQTDIKLNPFFVGFTPFIEDVRKGDSLPLVPKHRLSVTGNFHPTEEVTVSLLGLYVSTQFFQNDSQNIQPRLPGYFMLNARVAYERPVPGGRVTGFLMVSNLLDQQFFTSGIIASNVLTGGGAAERFVVPAPGIAIYGGLSYRFESF